jgi:hypothetical protein
LFKYVEIENKKLEFFKDDTFVVVEKFFQQSVGIPMGTIILLC